MSCKKTHLLPLVQVLRYCFAKVLHLAFLWTQQALFLKHQAQVPDEYDFKSRHLRFSDEYDFKSRHLRFQQLRDEGCILEGLPMALQLLQPQYLTSVFFRLST
jgi:hypothetical protein